MNEAQKARMRAELRRRKSQSKGADMSPMGRLKDNLIGVDDGVMSTGEKVGTWLNKAGEAMSLGVVGDEASAAAAGAIPGGMTYEERLAFERANEARMERENPGAMLAAEVAGGVAGLAIPGGAVGTLARGAGVIPRVAASAASGGAMGGVYGYAEGEGDNRTDEALEGVKWGAAIGGAVPAVGAGVQRVADNVLANRAIKKATRNAATSAQQRAAGGQNYDAFEAAGAEISPEAMTRLRTGVVEALDNGGMSKIPSGRKLTPGAQTIIDSVTEMDSQVRAAAQSGENPAVPLTAIEDLRRVASDVAQGVDQIGRSTRDSRLGSIVIDEIDSFVDALKESNVPIGDPQKAVEALDKARKLWSQSKKTQLLDDVLDAQDDYLGGAASAIRNKIGSLLRNRKMSRQFTSGEKAVLRRIIGGNGLSRAIRLMGNGIGRQAQMAGGAALGGVPGAVAGVITGELSAEVANRKAVQATEAARSIISSGVLDDLPLAPDTVRQITEQVLRQVGAVVPQ